MEFYDEFKALLEDEDKEACIDWALKKLESGDIGVVDLYASVLTPALNSIVCKEEDEAMCIWNEHVKTNIVRAIVECAFPYVVKARNDQSPEPKNTLVLVLCPPDELHDLGARMVADYFTIAGFKATFIGSNTPQKAILAAIKTTQPRFVAISVSNPYHVFKTQKIIAEIKSVGNEGLEIILGGSALKNKPELFKQLDGDRHLNDFNDIMNLGGE